MSSNVDVAVMGYIFNENIKYPDKVVGPFLGGTASYAAVCLGRLGTRTGIISNIGTDTPESLLKPFFEANVDTTGFNIRIGISTTKDLLVYDELGNKHIEYITRAPLILVDDIPDSYLNSKIFHLCEVDFEVPLETVKEIKNIRRDVKISADLGGVGGAHSTPEMRKEYILNNNGIKFKEYLECIDYAKASQEDCIHMFGKDFNDPFKAAKKLLGYGIEIAIITLGKDGALIATRDQKIYKIPAVDLDGDVVDCTGAGDTFISAFISEYLVSHNVKRAGVFASTTSSILIEKTGGVSIDRSPSREMVITRMERFCKKKNISLME